MSNYIGVRCPVCNKKFIEADDIVVCPVCGAPHHRDCYMQANQCAFAADHLSGKEWRDPAGQVPPHEAKTDDAARACSRCGSNNPPEAIFCQVCGNPLRIQPPDSREPQAEQWGFPGFQVHVDTISMAYGGLSPDEEIDGESVKDLARYIGNGSAYYLPRFRIFSDHNRTVSPNFSALIFNFFYYFYRKMYLVGSVLLAIYLVGNIPTYLYTWEVMPQMLFNMGLGPAAEINTAAVEHLYRLSNITRGISFFITLVVSMCANRIYYSRVIGNVHRLRTGPGVGLPTQDYELLLARQGGSSKTAVIVAGVTVFTLLFVLSAVMMFLRMPGL